MNPTCAWLWQPVISPLHIGGLAAVLAALAVMAYARTFRARPAASSVLLVMRLALLAAMATLLMGPSRIPPEASSPARAKLLVLVDTSASMRTEDCQGLGRLEFAQKNWLNAQALGKLAEAYDLELLGFDGELHPLSPAALQRPADALAAGRVSRIAECLRKALQSFAQPSGEAAMLVFSDGHDSGNTPFQPLALLARARNVPIHTVCLGGPTLQRDLVLEAVAQQQYLLAGETGQVLAIVHQVGLEQSRTSLHVRCNDQQETHEVRFAGGDAVELKLPAQQDQPGLYEYRVWVDPVPGEVEAGNNAQSVFLEVTNKRIKVLILEGEPFWDTRFAAQSLRKDDRVELTQITQLTQQKKEAIVTRADANSPQVPVTAEELASYDVVVVGRGLENLLAGETVRLLPEYVSARGGNIIFARGRAYDPETAAGRQLARDISVLEPVVWDRGQVHNLSLSITSAGRSTPCFAFGNLRIQDHSALSRLPGFSVMPAVAQEKASAIVLARAWPPGRAATEMDDRGGHPAVVSMDYGRGRILAILGEGLWRWSFLPPELAAFQGVYDIFWSNLVRWLAMGSEFLPGEEVSLKISHSSIRLGDPVLLDVACKFPPAPDALPRLTVTAPDGQEHGIPLRRLEEAGARMQCTFTGQQTGVYRAALDCPALSPGRIEKKFSIYNLDFEQLQTSANPQGLRALAEQSGGIVLQKEQAAELPEQLAQLQAHRQAPRRPIYIWDKGALLTLLLVWAGTEWLLRKRAGML